MLPVDQTLERLGVVDPLERTKSIGHRRDCKRLEVDFAIEARGIFFEDLVHDREELLHSLVKAKVFATLDQQMVILLVTAVHSDALRSLDRAENQQFFLDACDFDIL